MTQIIEYVLKLIVIPGPRNGSVNSENLREALA